MHHGFSLCVSLDCTVETMSLAGSAGSPELCFRALPYLDKKWIKADVSSALRCSEDLANLWNHLVQDEEIVTGKLPSSINASGDVAYLRADGKYYCGVQSLTCTCCKGVCSATSSCCCAACQLLEAEEGPTKKNSGTGAQQQLGHQQQNHNQSEPVGICSGTILDSWLWSPIPSKSKRLFTENVIDISNSCRSGGKTCLHEEVDCWTKRNLLTGCCQLFVGYAYQAVVVRLSAVFYRAATMQTGGKSRARWLSIWNKPGNVSEWNRCRKVERKFCNICVIVRNIEWCWC